MEDKIIPTAEGKSFGVPIRQVWSWSLCQLGQGILSLQNFVVSMCQHMLFWRGVGALKTDDVQRVLVMRTANIGDMIVAIPALRAIRERFPRAEITLLTTPGTLSSVGAEQVLSGQGVFDRVVDFSRLKPGGAGGRWNFAALRRLVQQERRYGYDCFIHLPAVKVPWFFSLKIMCFVRLIGITRATGFFDQVYTNHFIKEQAKYHYFPDQVEQLLNALPWQTGPAKYDIRFAGKEKTQVEKLWEKWDCKLDEPVMAVSFYGKVWPKIYPYERYPEIFRWYLNHYGGKVLLIGGPGEREVADKICADTRDYRVLNICGMTSIQESLYLLTKVDLLLSIDTGTAHMAAAVGCNLIELFSAYKYPHLWQAHGNTVRVLRHDLPCSPCWCDECKFGGDYAPCMKSISIDDICIAVAEYMDGKKKND